MGGFGEYYGHTNLHPLALTGALILGLLIFRLPARLALAPLFIAATSLPMAQRIVIGGVDLTLMRLMLLAYLLRILFRKEYRGIGKSRVDTAVMLWALAGTVVAFIHYGTVSTLVYRAGWAYDILLTYMVTRCVIRSADDVMSLAKIIAVVSVPVAAFFLFERLTRYNVFSIFGGVSAITWIREGKLRCTGPFAHPIMAGTFWAATLPLLWLLWHGYRDKAGRMLAAIGFGAAVLIIINTASSTSLLGMMAAFVGIALFRFRQYRTQMWVGLFAVLTLLHLVMEAPVWHLISRIDLVGGSTGWHRYKIFDAFINNFSKWYLTGETNAMSWGVWEMRDITNQYVLEGVRGGLLTLTAFVLILGYCFGSVGRSLKILEPLKDIAAERVVWMVGATMFMHSLTFFGVSYFAQTTAILYMQFGIAGGLLPQILPNMLSGGAVVDQAPARPRLTLGRRADASNHPVGGGVRLRARSGT